MPTLDIQDTETTETVETVEMMARRLADEAANDPYILRTYWFPAENEVRLVYIDILAPPSLHIVTPFYFGTSKEQGLFYPSAVAVIDRTVEPGQPGEIAPPAGWGTWADAHKWEAHS